jgi:hypothetical protein
MFTVMKKFCLGGAQAGSVSGSRPQNDAPTDDVPQASDDDEREECPEGTGCGIRTNVLHRGKYKHVKPTVVAGKNEGN